MITVYHEHNNKINKRIIYAYLRFKFANLYTLSLSIRAVRNWIKFLLYLKKLPPCRLAHVETAYIVHVYILMHIALQFAHSNDKGAGL